MSEKKVLTKEELDTLKGFQDQENNIVFSFGQIAAMVHTFLSCCYYSSASASC